MFHKRQNELQRKSRPFQFETLEERRMLATVAGDIVFRVNAGGEEIAGTPAWIADTQAAPSEFSNFDPTANNGNGSTNTFTTGASIDLSDPSIPAGTPEAVFQSQRFDRPNLPNLEWSFPVTAGAYEVRLFFAETFAGAFSEGFRRFDVEIEGQQVLDDFDIFTTAGGGNRGIVETFTVTSDENLDIDFLRAGANNPVVQGIEIIALDGDDTPTTSPLGASATSLDFGAVDVGESSELTVTLTNDGAPGASEIVIDPTSASLSPVNAAFSFDFDGTAPITLAAGESTTVSVAYTPTATGDATGTLTIPHDGTGGITTISLAGEGVEDVTPVPNDGDVVFRINAGGVEIDGTPIWIADTQAAPSEFSNFDPAANNGNGSTNSFTTSASIDLSDPSIPAGTPEAIFQSQRFDRPNLPNLEWDLPVEAGAYEVRLFFAETFTAAFSEGFRRFDVEIEGEQVLDDFDIFTAAGGGNRGIVETFTVTSDGNLDIDFLRAGANNPVIQGIEVISLDDASPAASPLGASSTALDFGSVVAGESAELTVTLTNDGAPGASDIVIDPASAVIAGATGGFLPVGGVAQPFAFNFGTSSPITLAPGESTAVAVTYSPTVEGSNATIFTIPHDGIGGSITIDLAGEAVADVPPPPPIGSDVVFRVNAGGAEVAGTPVWVADTQAAPSEFSNFDPAANNGNGSSSSFSTSASIDLSDPSIPVGTPEAIFQSQRFDRPNLPNLEWDFTVTPGEYEVRLFFAETFAGAFSEGFRRFDVEIEGQQVLDDFDIFTAAGGGNRGIVETFTVTSDGNLDIDLLRAGANNPVVQGIEIISLDVANNSPLVASASTLNFGRVEIGESSDLAVTLTNSGEAGASQIVIDPASASITPAGSEFSFDFGTTAPITLAAGESTTVTVTYAPTAGGNDTATLSLPFSGGVTTIDLAGVGDDGTLSDPLVLFRVNAGGEQIAGDPIWTADTESSPSQFNSSGQSSVSGTFSTEESIDLSDPSIPAGTPEALFQTTRFLQPAESTLEWDFQVTPGEYEVRLYFAEIFEPAFEEGFREFDVEIEGQLVLDNYDIFAAAGAGNRGIVETFTITSDGNLDIDLLSQGIQNPAIQAIEIVTFDEANVPLPPIDFGRSILGGTDPLNRPTSLQFGPDGRLYVSQQNGLIRIYTIERNGANDFSVVSTETITQIAQLANRDDDGTLNPSVTGRLVTGLLVTGTADEPIIYVTSSDPRIGGGPSGESTNLDTNSGILSRLTFNGSSWDQLDLVRGLPRSEENHTTNGLQLDEETNTLFIAAGGNTNQGAPSNNFAFLPEFALSAAILSVDLDAIGETTYDIPTLDDDDQPGVDITDPFGGNDGNNQAILVPGGPVQVYAPGFRNAYDIVLTSQGRLYTVDNGPNAGWGDVPIGEGPEGNATNEINEPGQSFGDGLHFIRGEGYFGGHPNPTRSNPNNTFNTLNPQSPVSVANPIESDFQIPGVEDGSLIVYPNSTNGITEFTSNAFGGQLQGDLIIASFDNTIKRVKLDAEGDDIVIAEDLFSNVGAAPLDVTTPSFGPFAGSIWVADIGLGEIIVYEPSDGSGGTPDDLDGDGFSNEDEEANGTDPTNSASAPADNDGDFVSNLLDLDDDNDSLPDVSDPFAIDADNGASTPIGFSFEWENEGDTLGGLLNLGFTGVQTNGIDDYESLFDPSAVTAGGAAGVFTIDNASVGTALGSANTQDQALQVGFNAADATSPFTAETRVFTPFNGVTPQAGQQIGFFVGLGDQDNYVQIVLDGAGEIQVLSEFDGQPTLVASTPATIVGTDSYDFRLTIDPTSGLLQASYALAGETTFTNVGSPISLPADWLTGSLAAGLISTNPTGSQLSATWDFLRVVESDETIDPPAPNPAGQSALIAVAPGGSIVNASTFQSDSFLIRNESTSDAQITAISIDLSTGFLPDVVFDPSGGAGDATAKPFTADSGAATTGLIGSDQFAPRDGGFDGLTISFSDFDPGEEFTFSIDTDPTTIQGASAPGPGQSGSISGLEIAGATVTATYSNGTTQSGQLFVVDGSSTASQVLLTADTPAAPSIELLDVTDRTVVGEASQTLRVTGSAGDTVRVFQAESGLFLSANPFDIDSFETNRVLNADHISVTVGASGFVDVPVVLTDNQTQGGINHFLAVVEEGDVTSPLSNAITVALNDLPPGAISPWAGDLNSDHHVDNQDFDSFKANFGGWLGNQPAAGAAAGVVDAADFVLFRDSFGATSPMLAEPTATVASTPVEQAANEPSVNSEAAIAPLAFTLNYASGPRATTDEAFANSSPVAAGDDDLLSLLAEATLDNSSSHETLAAPALFDSETSSAYEEAIEELLADPTEENALAIFQ